MAMLFDIVIPVFLLVALGWLSRKTELLKENSAQALNQYVFYIAVPALMFLSTAKVDIGAVLHWGFILAYIGGSVIAVAVAFLAWRRMTLQAPLDWTVVALNAAWPNTVYMGVPIFYFMFGEQGTLPVVISTLASNLLFILVLALMSELQRSSGSIMQKLRSLLLQALLKNPVMMAPLLGMAVSVSGVSLPVALLTPLEMLAPSAAPVALFALGISLYGLQVKGAGFELGWLSLVKLVVHPLAVYLIAVWVLQLEPFWAVSAVLLAALPTGAMVFVLAQQYRTRVTLSSATIMVTTLASIVTLALLLPYLKQWTL
ncbi:AEC family transporter [Amphritea sp. HPY]|uniref:AEC family transporter n=1 Tax=Amphritea sp. HPY TaxID=3421652 RepID=UPI003D7CC908